MFVTKKVPQGDKKQNYPLQTQKSKAPNRTKETILPTHWKMVHKTHNKSFKLLLRLRFVWIEY